jgi:hypothetical protein
MLPFAQPVVWNCVHKASNMLDIAPHCMPPQTKDSIQMNWQL